MVHIPDFAFTGPCKFLQGKHCTKIGCKCVEKRFWSSDTCLIADKPVRDRIPTRPNK